jgi:hypothetical protein
MHMASYTHTAKKDGHLIRFELQDHTGRTVAVGTGATVSAAKQDALEKTPDKPAQVYLGQVHFAETLTE